MYIDLICFFIIVFLMANEIVNSSDQPDESAEIADIAKTLGFFVDGTGKDLAVLFTAKAGHVVQFGASSTHSEILGMLRLEKEKLETAKRLAAGLHDNLVVLQGPSPFEFSVKRYPHTPPEIVYAMAAGQMETCSAYAPISEECFTGTADAVISYLQQRPQPYKDFTSDQIERIKNPPQWNFRRTAQELNWPGDQPARVTATWDEKSGQLCVRVSGLLVLAPGSELTVTWQDASGTEQAVDNVSGMIKMPRLSPKIRRAPQPGDKLKIHYTRQFRDAPPRTAEWEEVLA